MLKYALKLMFNKIAPDGYIGPHGTMDRELMMAGHKPIVMMADYSQDDLEDPDMNPVIRKWAGDFKKLEQLADEGKILRKDFSVELSSPHRQIDLVLFGREGEETNMQAIQDLYDWEVSGCQGPPPHDKDMGYYLGYSESDVKAWNLACALSAAAKYVPFLTPAIGRYMKEYNTPARDSAIQQKLQTPTENTIIP